MPCFSFISWNISDISIQLSYSPYKISLYCTETLIHNDTLSEIYSFYLVQNHASTGKDTAFNKNEDCLYANENTRPPSEHEYGDVMTKDMQVMLEFIHIMLISLKLFGKHYVINLLSHIPSENHPFIYDNIFMGLWSPFPSRYLKLSCCISCMYDNIFTVIWMGYLKSILRSHAISLVFKIRFLLSLWWSILHKVSYVIMLNIFQLREHLLCDWMVFLKSTLRNQVIYLPEYTKQWLISLIFPYCNLTPDIYFQCSSFSNLFPMWSSAFRDVLSSKQCNGINFREFR